MYCNVNTKRCSDRDYNMYKFLYGCTPPCCRSHLYTLLKNTGEILSGANIKYWIIAGSLLGAVRDNNIVKTDFDVDMGVFEGDFDGVLNLADKFIERGFGFERQLGVSFLKIVVTRSKENKNWLDIFPYRNYGNGMCFPVAGAHKKYEERLGFDEKDIIDLEENRIRDYYFPIPKNAHVYMKKLCNSNQKN